MKAKRSAKRRAKSAGGRHQREAGRNKIWWKVRRIDAAWCSRRADLRRNGKGLTRERIVGAAGRVPWV